LFGQCQHQINGVNVVTALHRIARLPDGHAAANTIEFQALAERAASDAASEAADARGLANPAWSFAALGIVDGPLLTSISAQSMKRIY